MKKHALIREGCKNLFTEFLLNSVCDVFLGFDQFFQGHSVYPTIVKNKITGPLKRMCKQVFVTPP